MTEKLGKKNIKAEKNAKSGGTWQHCQRLFRRELWFFLSLGLVSDEKNRKRSEKRLRVKYRDVVGDSLKHSYDDESEIVIERSPFSIFTFSPTYQGRFTSSLT